MKNPSTLTKAIDIIHEIVFAIKTTGKGIQLAGDVAWAKRIRSAIAENNIKKLKRIATRGGIFIDKNDIIGIFKSDKTPGVLVSPEYIVKYGLMFKKIRRDERNK